MTIKEFFALHTPCNEFRDWALENCKTMQEIWDTAKPDRLIWVATQPGVLDDRTLRLFACWCVRQVWYLLTDERSRTAVEVAERFVNGNATTEEMYTAGIAACSAVRTTAPATWAAYDATYDAPWEAVWAVARDAARAAENPAAARAAQASWLRQNVKPNFSAPKPTKSLATSA